MYLIGQKSTYLFKVLLSFLSKNSPPLLERTCCTFSKKVK